MGTKQMSKQEQRLAKGKAKLAAAEQPAPAPVVEQLVEALAGNTTDNIEVVVESAEAEAARAKDELAQAFGGDVEGARAQANADVDAALAAAAATPTPPAAGVPTLHVKQGLALRGGRGEWYKLLCQYDGKPVADYIAAGKANPASHYTARSVKCGQPKTPESRLSWFKRAGIVTIR